MLDTVRRYVEAGREALTPKKAEDLARSLIREGQARADQAGRIARDLLEWSLKSSERFRETIRGEVKKQMSRAGVASKEEVESLKRRIRELESKSKTTTAKAKSSSSRATTQRSASTRSGSRASGRTRTQTTGATRVPKGSAPRTRSRGAAGRTKPPGTRGA